MSIPQRLLALAAATLALTACGADDSAPAGGASTSTPEELARLVPANSTVFVQLASIDALERFVRGMGAGEGFTLDPADLLAGAGMAGLDGALVARDRPLGIALALVEGGLLPEVTAVLPVRDAEAFVAGWTPAQPDQHAATTQGYVGISNAAGYAAGERGAPIAKLTTQVFALHADLRAVIDATRPMLDAQLDQAEQMLSSISASQTAQQAVDVSGVMGMYFELAGAMLDSLESLDLTLAEAGQLASLELDLTMAPGSALAKLADGKPSALAAAAASIDPNAAISFLAGGDMARIMGWFEPFYDQLLEVYPESMRAGMRRYLDGFESAYALFGDAMAGDVSFGDEGLSMAMAIQSDDPEALRAKYVELASSYADAGFKLDGAPETIALGEREGTRLRIQLDLEQLAELGGGDAAELEPAFAEMMSRFLGPDGAQVYLVPAGDELAFVMTPDEVYLERALSRIGAGGSGAAGFEWVLERFAHASPVIAYRMDVPRMMVQITDLLEAGTGAPPPFPPGLEEQSLPAVLVGGFEGRRWRAGVSLDRRDLVAFVAAIQEQ